MEFGYPKDWYLPEACSTLEITIEEPVAHPYSPVSLVDRDWILREDDLSYPLAVCKYQFTSFVGTQKPVQDIYHNYQEESNKEERNAFADLTSCTTVSLCFSHLFLYPLCCHLGHASADNSKRG